MRLSAVEAVRYGALEDGCIRGLGDGLNVVLGPNESGKSTFTALTRHVLYGFPDARTKERSYLPPEGVRRARLLFTDGDGEWAVERVEGPRRGPALVHALRGDERPGLLADVVAGVSEHTYRVVFGFGLDELAEIEKRDNEDIVARLYAAGTGLQVNPIDTRAQLEVQAGELWSPRARKPLVNTLNQQMGEVRSRIRQLETAAASFASEQEHLTRLDAELAPLRARRDELDKHARELARASQRANDVETQARGLRAELASLASEFEQVERSLELIEVDERALDAAPAVGVLAEEASGYRQRLEALTNAINSANDADRRAQEINLPPEVRDSPEHRAAVERWRGRLTDAKHEAEATEKVARMAEERLAATRQAQEQLPAHSARSNARMLATLTLGVGVIALVAGVLSAQWLSAALGAMLAVAGLAFLLMRPQQAVAPTLDLEVARLEVDAQATASVRDASAAALATAEVEWRSWIAEHSLDVFGDDPVAVLQLLDRARDRDALGAERIRFEGDARREREAAEAWVLRLVDVARAMGIGDGQIPELSSAPELLARVRIRVDKAKTDFDERKSLRERGETLARERQVREERLAVLDGELRELAARFDAEREELDVVLETLTESAELELDQTRLRCESLAEEVTALRTRLDEDARNSAMALARQEFEGVREQLAQAANRYVVTSLAVALLDRARERFEKERQPEVIKHAADVFAKMTEGRYVDIRVPLDGSGISVIGANGSVRSSSQLSRGTAEQLYLALRIGLIGVLGETGRSLPLLMDDVVVNFDPQRRDGAVEALAELSKLRQVLFFTCHPETAELLAKSVPSSTVVELDRC